MNRLALALILLICLLLVAPYFVTAAYCDGWYDLTVEVDAEYAKNAVAVSYVCCNDAEMADTVLTSLDEPLPAYITKRCSPAPFLVSVGFSYRQSPLGPTWGHVQEYAEIVLVLHRENGARTVHRLQVPHRNKSRRVVVDAASEVNLSMDSARE